MAHFVLLIVCFFVSRAFSLICYECDERSTKSASGWCPNPKKQRCDTATSICLKYLHKEGKPGFPNHVIAKCDLRSSYTQNKLNACDRSVRRRNDALTITETCTCDTDLCNDASMDSSKIMDAVAGGPRPEPEPEPTVTTAATTAETLEHEQDEEDEEEDEEDEEDEELEDFSTDPATTTPKMNTKDEDKISSEETKSESADNAAAETGAARNVIVALLCGLLSIESHRYLFYV